jgi:hypothetical protein
MKTDASVSSLRVSQNHTFSPLEEQKNPATTNTMRAWWRRRGNGCRRGAGEFLGFLLGRIGSYMREMS